MERCVVALTRQVSAVGLTTVGLVQGRLPTRMVALVAAKVKPLPVTVSRVSTSAGAAAGETVTRRGASW